MVQFSMRWLARWLALAALLAPATAWAQGESTRLRFVIVVDTEDQMGKTWGQDGDNVRAVVAAAAQRQNLGPRVAIDVLSGKQVTPENIINHLRTMPVGAEETLAFYYSGHGGFSLSKGHYLALRWGKLYRSAIMDALQAHKPRLVVMLTDCCSNIAGGARQTEPPFESFSINAANARSFPRAQRAEPPSQQFAQVETASLRTTAPPRANSIGLARGVKAKLEEPPDVAEFRLAVAKPLNLVKARLEEPTNYVRAGKGVTLVTGAGSIAVADIAAATDGVIVRDLFFRSRGVVDINGCKKGALSHGTLDWGGSLFTNALLALQKHPVASLDANHNQVVEWAEFFPALQKGTEDAAQRAGRGKIRQTPEAWRLDAR